MHLFTNDLSRTFLASLVALSVLIVVDWKGSSTAQAVSENPYQVIYHWGELPDGREMGVVTGVHPDPDGEHMWIVERCSTNQCAGSNLPPIHKLDREGKVVKSIGAGLFAWPHGFDLDGDGYLWVTEGAPEGDARGTDGFSLGMGHQVIKLNQEGEVLMRLGVAGVAGDDATHFNGPSAVQVAPMVMFGSPMVTVVVTIACLSFLPAESCCWNSVEASILSVAKLVGLMIRMI